MANLLETSSPDPFTVLYCGVWDLLENHAGFIGLVAMPNRIKFLGNRIEPGKDHVTNTDLPEVTVEPTIGDGLITTDQSKLIVGFDVVAKTDNQRLDTLGPSGLGGAVFPVGWEIYRALLGQPETLKALLYSGTRFVSQVWFESLDFHLDHKDKPRGIIGWAARMRYVVRTTFNTAAIGPTAVGG